jgi:hypothetical protein
MSTNAEHVVRLELQTGFLYAVDLFMWNETAGHSAKVELTEIAWNCVRHCLGI